MISADGFAFEVYQYIFDSLIERNLDTLEFEPKLATHWEVSDNNKEFTFYMRKDVKWHDGHPVTADDVVFSLELIQPCR